MSEDQEAIVLSVIPDLRPYVSELNARQWLMSFLAAQGNYEELHSIVLAIDDQPRSHSSEVGELPQFSRPILTRGDRWGVEHELVSNFV